MLNIKNNRKVAVIMIGLIFLNIISITTSLILFERLRSGNASEIVYEPQITDIMVTKDNTELFIENDLQNILFKISKGTKIEVISDKSEVYQIRVDKVIGYVKSDKLENMDSSISLYTINTTLPFRPKPNSKKSFCNIARGSVVEFIGKEGAWSRIRYNGTFGYVSSNYIEEVK